VAAGELDERIERVAAGVLASALAPRLGEQLVADAVEHRVEPRPVLGGAPGLEVPRTLGVGPSPQPPAPVQPASLGIGVGVGLGAPAGALLSQLAQAGPLCDLQETDLGPWILVGGVGDFVDLLAGQLAAAQRVAGVCQPRKPPGGLEALFGRG
jgi:hypothetical protein